MNRKPQGVISYAGLDVATLLAGARLMFTSSEEQLPRRFASLMPLFPLELIQSMPFVGVAQPGENVAPGGFSIDPATYHCLIHSEMPRLYVGDNLARNTDADGVFHGRGVVTVDEAWTTCFPQYQPFQGERLTIYPLGGGAQVVAVPESLYPKAAGFLRQAETALGVTRRCHDYAHYVYQRIRAGEAFDADEFENDYLTQNQLTPVTIAQSDLGRMMQDISMLKNALEGGDGDGLYTENAKRAEHILQYVPDLYACDVFEDVPITRYTARLLQPVWEDGFVSDWWLPYGDAAAYAAADRLTLDMAALCQGFQLAPVYDPQTRGGRYPSKVRVVILRDKDLRLRMADTLNNPAYGSGMSPLGAINKLVYLPGSRELLRQGKLTLEEAPFRCENTAVSPRQYRNMTAMAALQESKGQLVDALYRRESVLSEVRDTSPDHGKLHTLMNQPVEALESRLSGREKAQLSGYDADVDYLRRMGMEREWKPGPKKQKTFRFAPDSLRQASIESGFAMRAACLHYDWAALALPAEDANDADTEEMAVSAQATNGQQDAPSPAERPSDTTDEPQWLNYLDELDRPILPERPPLWLNAADPCYLTTDVGGLYPTDEELASTGAQPPTLESLQALAEAQAAAAKAAHAAGKASDSPKVKKAAKSGKGGKGGKTGKAKAVAKQPSDGNRFSDEEMERRQIVLELPVEETPVAVTAPEVPDASQPASDADASLPAKETQPTPPAADNASLPEEAATAPAATEAPAQPMGNIPVASADNASPADEDPAKAGSAASGSVFQEETATLQRAAADDASLPEQAATPAATEAPAQPESSAPPANAPAGKPKKSSKSPKSGKAAHQPIEGQISFLTGDLF